MYGEHLLFFFFLGGGDGGGEGILGSLIGDKPFSLLLSLFYAERNKKYELRMLFDMTCFRCIREAVTSMDSVFACN